MMARLRPRTTTNIGTESRASDLAELTRLVMRSQDDEVTCDVRGEELAADFADYFKAARVVMIGNS